MANKLNLNLKNVINSRNEDTCFVGKEEMTVLMRVFHLVGFWRLRNPEKTRIDWYKNINVWYDALKLKLGPNERQKMT